MKKITINKGNGGVPKSLPGQDHYSGFVMYLADANLPAGFSTTDRIKQISTVATAEALGITSDSANWEIRTLHYHLSEAIRKNPAIVLWVGMFLTPVSTYDFTEIKTIQQKAEGKIRKCTVWAYQLVLAAVDLTTLKGIADELDALKQPLQIGYCPKIDDIVNLDTTMVLANLRNVCVSIGQDGDGLGNDLFIDVENTTANSVGLAGLLCGDMSLAKVHESIAWTEKFQSGIPVPAFADGTLLRDVDAAVITTLDEMHYLFLNYDDTGGVSWYDSWTMDLDTSDYCKMEANISMDKAIRGIRAYLAAKLSGPIYLQDDGTLRPDDLPFLKCSQVSSLKI